VSAQQQDPTRPRESSNPPAGQASHDVQPAREADRQPGPSGLPLVFATVAMFAFVAAIFLLLGLGGWAPVGGAIALMVIGVFVVSRYVQHLSLGDEVHEQIAAHDLPRGNPTRLALEYPAGRS